jgi:hypothetical protein
MGNLGDVEMENEEQSATGAAKHGQYFYGVELQNRTVVMFYADRVAIEPSGVLCAYRKRDEGMQITLAWLPGQWLHFWAASVLDGQPIAVDSVISPSDSKPKVKASRKIGKPAGKGGAAR